MDDSMKVIRDFLDQPAVKVAVLIGLALAVDKVFLNSKYSTELADKLVRAVVYEDE